MTAANRTPGEIDSAWLDKMVKKLFETLESQLQQVAKARPGAKDAAARAANARTLSALERTLERLARMERERQAAREKRTECRDGVDARTARAALERRLDERLAALEAGRPAEKPD